MQDADAFIKDVISVPDMTPAQAAELLQRAAYQRRMDDLLDPVVPTVPVEVVTAPADDHSDSVSEWSWIEGAYDRRQARKEALDALRITSALD